MFSRNRDDTHESGTTGRNRTDRSQRPRCVIAYRNREARQDFQRNLEPAEAGRGINISGVDFWHAVEFSRNGRFLCTHPLGLSSGLSLRSCISDSIRLFRVRFPVEAGSAFQFFAFAFPFPASPTLSDPFGPDSQSV